MYTPGAMILSHPRNDHRQPHRVKKLVPFANDLEDIVFGAQGIIQQRRNDHTGDAVNNESSTGSSGSPQVASGGGDAGHRASPWHEAGAAAISGSLHSLIETPIVTPIEAAITQQQLNGRAFLWNLNTLFEQKALYRGLSAGLIGAIPKAIVHYSFLTAWSNVLAPEGNLSTASPLVAWGIGSVVGATEVWFTNPVNLVKFRMQRPEWGYKNVVDAVKTIHAKEGLGAFWKGAPPVAVRNCIMNGAMVGAFTYVNNALAKKFPNAPADLRRFVAGSTGGVAGSLMSYPFEMMRAAAMHNLSFRGHILSKGPKRLLAGYIPGASRLVLTSAVMGLIIPRMKHISLALEGAKKGTSTDTNKLQQKPQHG